MTDMTLEAALKLADQDSPLPSLAGPALKVLRERLHLLEAALRAAATSIEKNGDADGIGIGLRLALGDAPRVISWDLGHGDDHTTVCVAVRDDNESLRIEHVVQWPRRAGRTSADLAALKMAIAVYPSKNKHQMQAAKVCAGIVKLAEKLRNESASQFIQGLLRKPAP